nr:PREDICTED: uncharacterized protein LOC103547169 [Equus przewalskii]
MILHGLLFAANTPHFVRQLLLVESRTELARREPTLVSMAPAVCVLRPLLLFLPLASDVYGVNIKHDANLHAPGNKLLCPTASCLEGRFRKRRQEHPLQRQGYLVSKALPSCQIMDNGDACEAVRVLRDLLLTGPCPPSLSNELQGTLQESSQKAMYSLPEMKLSSAYLRINEPYKSFNPNLTHKIIKVQRCKYFAHGHSAVSRL